MPLEIRELVIKVDIQETNPAHNIDIDDYLEELKNKVIKECLQEVITKLENFFER